jgi:predicted metal-binding protein
MLDYLKETKDVGCFTSLATLMANCSVLDLDTFERCIKAEVLGMFIETISYHLKSFLFRCWCGWNGWRKEFT